MRKSLFELVIQILPIRIIFIKLFHLPRLLVINRTCRVAVEAEAEAVVEELGKLRQMKALQYRNPTFHPL